MSLIAISIFVGGVDELPHALQRAADALRQGARLIEWRVDALASSPGGEDAAVRLVRESPGPCIVTCRSSDEGGMYAGDDEARLSLLKRVAGADAPPRYLDIELAAVTRHRSWAKFIADEASANGRDLHASIILSSHDFQRRPSDLLQSIEAMTTDGACSIIKVAWHARSLRDNLEAFDLLASRRKPTIALCMGRFGLMSRVLAGKFGGFLTFASDSADTATAPGQITIEQLRNRYRFDAITAATRVYGVVGWPVEHSRSPDVHNAGFSAVGHDGVLLPMPIPPEYEHFKATVGAMIDHRKLDFRGAAVTLPHKANLVRFVRERGGRLDDLSERIGAANTLTVGSAGGLSCANTDSPAALAALTGAMRIEPAALRDRNIAVLGAGGAARAVVAGVADTGARVRVFNRDRRRAELLMQELEVRQAEADDRFDVIINCTPIGMAGGPDPRGLPLALDGQQAVTIDHSMTVFDTIYTPQRTPLIAEAESRGAQVVTGLDMFLRQAAMQFQQWTGVAAPMDVFERAAG